MQPDAEERLLPGLSGAARREQRVLCYSLISLICRERARQEGLTEAAQVAVRRAGSNLFGLWPDHFCGNSWAESKTKVGWASPEGGTPALVQRNAW